MYRTYFCLLQHLHFLAFLSSDFELMYYLLRNSGSDLLKLSDCQLYLVFTAPKIKNNIHCCEPVTSTVLFKLQDNYLGVVFSVIEQK